LRFYTNLHSNGGTGFQPVQTQAEACGYQKPPYDCNLVLGYFFGEPGTFDHFTVPAPPAFSANCTAATPVKTGGVWAVTRFIFS
jgi:hypothetical protein